MPANYQQLTDELTGGTCSRFVNLHEAALRGMAASERSGALAKLYF